MKLTTNMVIQICAIVVQVGTGIAATQGLNAKVAITSGAVVAAAQAVSAYLGHISTTDGKPLSS
jgi:hypothetical protein